MTGLVPFTRLAAYLRKSRDDGEDSVEAVLARHERILQDWCRRTYDAPLPDSRILREIQSGETIESRPVMQQLMRMIRDGEIDGVFVVELQRLTRGDFIDIGELERLFRFSGCKIVTPSRTLSVAEDYDRQYFEMELLHGREYLSYIKKILRRGVEQSSREGNYVSPVPPFGYRKIWVNRRPTLEPVPEEAETVRLIFEWYAREGIGPTVIADRLNALGRTTRDGGSWSALKLQHIVENPVYTGKIRWNYIRKDPEYRDGRLVRVKHRHTDDSVILADGKHPAIISPELFDQAREAARSRKIPRANRPSEMRNPLAGLLRCQNCGHVMTAVPCRHYKSTELIDYTMRCTYTRACGMRGAYLRDVLAVLRDTLSASLRDLDVSTEEETAAPQTDTRKLYADELAEIERQQERLYGFLERGIYTDEVFLERRAKLTSRADEIAAALSRMDEETASAGRREDLRANLTACLALLDDPDTPARDLNAALKKILEKIVYSRAPRLSGRNEWTPIELSVFYL